MGNLLESFAKDVYSQYGEDGILKHIFDLLGVPTGYFCEFGAWDGIKHSNTYNLYLQGWSGCYIEGDPHRFSALQANIQRPNTKCICAMVVAQGDGEHSRTLDEILESTGAPIEFDLLSIDIDGDDLLVWKSLKSRSARVVVIEYNGTIPIGVEFANEGGGNRGNSCTSIVNYARSRDYILIAQTEGNLIFGKCDLMMEHGLPEIRLRPNTSYFFGYDGTLFFKEAFFEDERGATQILDTISVPWTQAFFPQPIPEAFRGYGQFESERKRFSAAVYFCYRNLMLLSRNRFIGTLAFLRRRLRSW